MNKASIARTVVILAALWATASTAAPTAAQRCEASKNDVAGRYFLCRHTAAKKLTLTGDTAKYAVAMARCDQRYSAKCQLAEAKAIAAFGTCQTTADEATIKSLLVNASVPVRQRLTGIARFDDNADGTITDNETELMWEKKVKLDGTMDYANLHDADDTYLWANYCSANPSKLCQPTAAAAAACAAAVEGDPSGCAQCTGGDGTCTGLAGTTVFEWIDALNTASFAGHADWRLPKRTELASIVDYVRTSQPAVNVAFDGASCGTGCANLTLPACSCSQGYTWSASTWGPDPGNAWQIVFDDGNQYATGKAFTYFARAVRAGPQ